MKCKEAINLWGSYRDGELDEAFCGEIQSHLKTCEECRRFFEAQQQFDASLTQVLQRGEPSESLWQRETSAIRATIQRPVRSRDATASLWREWLWPSPKFYGAMAALWALLLVVNHLADLGGPRGGQSGQPASQNQEALAEQRRQLRALIMVTEREQSLTAEHGLTPRSEWRPGPEAFPVGRAERNAETTGRHPELS
jgi:hypothetical protein